MHGYNSFICNINTSNSQVKQIYTSHDIVNIRDKEYFRDELTDV